MVEGPEYRRHAELLQVLVGQRLLRVIRAHTQLAQALADFAGLRVLRVLSVGKEIFVIFESRAQIEVEDAALRIHLGEGGGYVVTPKSGSGAKGPERRSKNATGSGRPWGPKAHADSRNPNGQPPPETELEFSDLGFALWDSLGSRYQVCPWSYVSTVEGRLHRDISFENFDYKESAQMIRRSEMLLVDLIMNQATLPGVGNIIKNEGLFRSRLHPLRKGSSLSAEECSRLLLSLWEFTQSWFDNCRRSPDGAHMGCSLPLCYGRSSCTTCAGPIVLMKEGSRKRLTFFCGTCQPADGTIIEFLARKRTTHRAVMPLRIMPCNCGALPVLQLFRKPGKNFGRLHAVCWKRTHANQPGCAGQHRRQLHGPKAGCKYLRWLDEHGSSLSPAELPRCACGERPVLRRVMSLRDNAQIFARCASRRCNWRLWLALKERDDCMHDATSTEGQNQKKALASACDLTAKRWKRHAGLVAQQTVPTRGDGSDVVQAAEGLPAPEITSAPARGKEAGASWSVGQVQAAGRPNEESDDPLTSGDEEMEEELLDEAKACLHLLSLEESWARLTSAKPPEAPPVFEKRWRKGRIKGSCAGPDHLAVSGGDFVAIGGSSAEELFLVAPDMADAFRKSLSSIEA